MSCTAAVGEPCPHSYSAPRGSPAPLKTIRFRDAGVRRSTLTRDRRRTAWDIGGDRGQESSQEGSSRHHGAVLLLISSRLRRICCRHNACHGSFACVGGGIKLDNLPRSYRYWVWRSRRRLVLNPLVLSPVPNVEVAGEGKVPSRRFLFIVFGRYLCFGHLSTYDKLCFVLRVHRALSIIWSISRPSLIGSIVQARKLVTIIGVRIQNVLAKFCSG